MNFTWRSPKPTKHTSVAWYTSTKCPGVRYCIRRVSLGQRIDLMQRARQLALQNEFLRAGTSVDQFEAALRDLLVRRMYLEWGLVSLDGLAIDDDPATPASLAEKGPEALSDEILEALGAELGLTEDERKNY